MEKKKKSIWKIILCMFLAIFLLGSTVVAVQNMESGDVQTDMEAEEKITPTPVSAPTQWIYFNINECDFLVDTYLDMVTYDTVTLSSIAENTIIAGDFAGYTIYINGQEIVPGGSITLQLDRLAVDNKIVFKYVEKATGIERKHYLNTLPPNYVEGLVMSNGVEEGYYYFNLNDYVYKMNTKGEIVYWRLAGGMDGISGGNDFKRTEVDGKVFYSFLYGGDSAEYKYLNGVNYGRMQAFVMDESYKCYDVVSFLVPYGEIGENCRMSNHQFTVLGERHYLISTYIGKQVNNIPDSVEGSAFGARVVANVIQEVKNGEVVFYWDSTEHPELYELSTDRDYTNSENIWFDYAHFNSVVVDSKDNHLICSFQNFNTVIKIDKTTGEILWKLGGSADEFGLSEEQKFYEQRSVDVGNDGAIILFSAENAEGGKIENSECSIKKYYLDETNKRLMRYEEYVYEGAYSKKMGNAQELSKGQFLVCWGERATALPLFSEIDFVSNKVLFEYFMPYEAESAQNAQLYRVYKFDK